MLSLSLRSAAGALLLALSAPAALAQDLLVDTTADNQPYNATTSLAECTDGVADDDCTLREAILVANASTTLDAIGFDVTDDLNGFGEAVIVPTSDLPTLTDDGTSIDGYSQAGTSRNTLAEGSNAVLVVVLFNGTGTVDDAIRLGGTGTSVAGLSILGFDDDGVEVLGDDAVVEGCFIGVAPDGGTPVANDFGVYVNGASGARVGADTDSDVGERNVISGNSVDGIQIQGSGAVVRGNLIGLTADGTAALGNGQSGILTDGVTGLLVESNVLSGNDVDGIAVFDSDATIQMNRIGTDATGTADLGNRFDGIYVEGSGSTDVDILSNLVAGNDGNGVSIRDGATGVLVQGNTVGIGIGGGALGNTDDGIEVEGASTATLLNNSIANNGSLGIQLDGATDNILGITPNDAGDGDSGPNGLLNYPVITGVAPATGGGYDVSFSLSTVASAEFWIEAYASTNMDESGHGEGRTLAATTTVTTDGLGEASGTLTLASLAAGEFVSLTATEYTSGTGDYGATSEFSATAGTGAELSGPADYRMLALPGGGTVDGLLGAFQTTGFPASDDPASAFCSVYTWDETQGSFDTGYTCVTDQSASLAAGEGVVAYIFEDDDPTASGTQGGFPKTLLPTAPSVTVPFTAFPLTYTDNVDTPAVEEGWNLLGNPLATALDWDGVSISGGLTRSVYVYDPNYLGGNYRTWSQGVGGDLTDGEIPAFQAFFAKAAAAAPALEVTPASVVPDGGPDVYGRTDQAASRLASPLRLTLSVEGTPASVAFVAPTEGAALGVDARDAFRLTPGAWPRAVLATTGVGDPEATALALNALPASTEGEIRLSVSVSLEGYAPGPLALSLAWQDLPEAWTATLVDDETGASVSLTEAGTYAFTVAVPETSSGVRPAALGLLPTPVAAPSASGPTAVSTHRFTIRLTRGGSVSTDTPPGDAFALRPPVPNPTRGLARVRYTLAEAGDARVSVHDLLGREVTTLADGAHTSGSHEASVDTNRLAPGVYLVRLSQGERLTTTRLTVVR